jgi:hypothetical protein
MAPQLLVHHQASLESSTSREPSGVGSWITPPIAQAATSRPSPPLRRLPTLMQANAGERVITHGIDLLPKRPIELGFVSPRPLPLRLVEQPGCHTRA